MAQSTSADLQRQLDTVTRLFQNMERSAEAALDRRAEEALEPEDETGEPVSEPVKCVFCREVYNPAQNHGGACFGHQPSKSRMACDVKMQRRYKLRPHGSVWTLDCCGKWFGSGSLDTPNPYPPMHQNDLGNGEWYGGLCAASLRRGVGAGPHVSPEDEDADVDSDEEDSVPIRRATAAMLSRLQARYNAEDRQLTKEQCIAELCEEDGEDDDDDNW